VLGYLGMSTYPTAVLVYWLNILATGLVGLTSAWYARKAGLLDGPTGEAAAAALKRRLWIGQILYASGAVLCLIHTYWSIAFIVIVQAWLAVGTRLPRRTRRPRGSPARNV
jgi:ABC-type Fe3+ transport system permease subunit